MIPNFAFYRPTTSTLKGPFAIRLEALDPWYKAM